MLLTRLKAYLKRLTKKKPSLLATQSAAVIMGCCTLQLDRDETRDLAPTPGATGPMLISGGALTVVRYSVFDRNADKVDKAIKDEPWRAFAKITMRLSLEKDPEFEVKIADTAVTTEAKHRAPGLALIRHLSHYFPLLPRTHTGPVIGGAA